jgi:hypothetical protein
MPQNWLVGFREYRKYSTALKWLHTVRARTERMSEEKTTKRALQPLTVAHRSFLNHRHDATGLWCGTVVREKVLVAQTNRRAYGVLVRVDYLHKLRRCLVQTSSNWSRRDRGEHRPRRIQPNDLANTPASAVSHHPGYMCAHAVTHQCHPLQLESRRYQIVDKLRCDPCNAVCVARRHPVPIQSHRVPIDRTHIGVGVAYVILGRLLQPRSVHVVVPTVNDKRHRLVDIELSMNLRIVDVGLGEAGIVPVKM